MAVEDSDLLNEQQRRRKRINQIKSGIIVTIAIWMVGSLLAIILLSVQVFQLNRQMDRLMEQQSIEENKGGLPSELPTGQIQNPTDRYTNIVTGIDTEENYAKEGDTHYVYLTFNSVPGENTKELLAVLAQYNVKATFFVTGCEEEGAAEVYRQIVNEGHTLGMHSYSNQYSLIYSSTEAFLSDFNKLADYLYELTGTQSSYYRFPGGSFNEISNVNMAEFVHLLNEEHVTYYDWNVTAGDAVSDYTKEDVVKNVVDGVSRYKTSVVLLHDGENKQATVDALGGLIENLQSQGAVILPIDENAEVIQYIKAESVK